jgi:hypothetical protein
MRQGNLPTVPTPFSAWVTINGESYAAVKIVVRYSRIETRAVVDLAVGTNARKPGRTKGIKAIPANFVFVKGVPAKVVIRIDSDVHSLHGPRGAPDKLLKAGDHDLITGIIDDGGPSDLANGKFNLRVVIVSRLLYLATGALHFSNTTSAYLRDDELVETTNNKYAGSINLNIFQRDFWEGIAEAFSYILKHQAKDTFGIQNKYVEFLADVSDGGSKEGAEAVQSYRAKPGTVAAQNALDLIQGKLQGGIFSSDMAQVIWGYLSVEFHKDLVRQSMLAKVQALADDFFFAIVEHGNGIGVVPYTPFAPTDMHKSLWPSTVIRASWITQSTSVVAGLVFIDNPNGPHGIAGSDSKSVTILGGFKRKGVIQAKNTIDPNGNSVGLFTTLPAPAWLKSPKIGNVTNADFRYYGDPYAREIALRQTYMGRLLAVDCPLRMDIGLCTPVKLVYPTIAGTPIDEATSMYGAVEGITLILDAAAKQAGTQLEIMYVRSKQHQDADVEATRFTRSPDGKKGVAFQHPLWAEAYRGRRLDEHPVAGGTSTPTTTIASTPTKPKHSSNFDSAKYSSDFISVGTAPKGSAKGTGEATVVTTERVEFVPDNTPENLA